jgi:hypothetical protein
MSTTPFAAGYVELCMQLSLYRARIGHHKFLAKFFGTCKNYGSTVEADRIYSPLVWKSDDHGHRFLCASCLGKADSFWCLLVDSHQETLLLAEVHQRQQHQRPFQSKEVEQTYSLPGTLEGTEFEVFCMEEEDYVMKWMATYGAL